MPFVYFIQAGDEDGPIKIGFADNPRARLNDLQTGHYEQLVLLGVIPCESIEEERKVQQIVAGDAIRGEWYRPTPAVLDLVAQSSHLDDLLPDAPRRSVRDESRTPRTPVRRVPDATEQARIVEAIATTKTLGQAAKHLGISRRTLQHRMRQLKLPFGRNGRPPKAPAPAAP